MAPTADVTITGLRSVRRMDIQTPRATSETESEVESSNSRAPLNRSRSIASEATDVVFKIRPICATKTMGMPGPQKGTGSASIKPIQAHSPNQTKTRVPIKIQMDLGAHRSREVSQ